MKIARECFPGVLFVISLFHIQKLCPELIETVVGIVVLFLLLLPYFLVLRGVGILSAINEFQNLRTPVPILEETSDGKVDVWNCVLEPFLDTDLPESVAKKNFQLLQSGLSSLQIRLIRLLIGIGFCFFIVADEWMYFGFSDFVFRWIVALVIDGMITIAMLYFFPAVGTFVAVCLALELIVFFGLLTFHFGFLRKLEA